MMTAVIWCVFNLCWA